MGVWSAITGFFGGTEGGGKVLDIADKAFYTDQEKHTDDIRETEAINQQFRPRVMGYGYGSGTGFDSVVDGLGRLQRPLWGVYLFGGLLGWWVLPDLGTTDTFWASMFLIYFTALFGGRSLLVDLPRAVGEFIKKRD